MEILEYRHHEIVFAGDVDGVVPGDIVFVVPMEYRYETDKHVDAADNFGNYVSCRLLATGEFVYGIP